MVKFRHIAASVVGLALLIGAGTALYKAYRPVAVPTRQPEADAGAPTLTIPTVDKMCESLGAKEGDPLKECQTNENAAGEFVIAWMAYNNFIVDGAISLDQIQLLASLDDSSPLAGLSDPSLGLDPSAGGDPSTGFHLIDPSAGSSLTAGIDPITGEPKGFLQSPAQLALFCLQMATDWMTMQNCLSQNDPSSHIGGTP